MAWTSCRPHAIDAFLLAHDSDFLSDPPRFDLLDSALRLWRYIIGLPQPPSEGLLSDLTRDAMLPMTRASGIDPALLEIVFIAESQRLHTPRSLLEWRLNSVYFGGEAFGIQAAAHVTFGIRAQDLDLAQAALLAVSARQPHLNPHSAEQDSRDRAADLLFAMLDAQLIDKAQFESANASQPVILAPTRDAAAIAPNFASYARQQAAAILERQHGNAQSLIARGGLRIITTLDLDLQRRAQSAGGDSLVVIDANSGELLSLHGDALARQHQPATLLHPIVYMQAFLQRELTPASMVFDVPRAYPGPQAELIYSPGNADGSYRGALNLRDAMAAHLLAPAVQVASAFPMSDILATARALGMQGLDAAQPHLELLERGGQVSLLDAAHAYSVLAALGKMPGLPADGERPRDPLAILEIADSHGELLWSYQREQAGPTQIIEPSLAYLVNDILADDEARRRTLHGATPATASGRTVATLVGESADGRDSWRLAYSPDLVIAAHLDGQSAADMEESAWQALIDSAHARLDGPPGSWQRPPDIEEYLVCEISGLLPATTDHCPTRREILPAGASLRRDDMWQRLEINSATGLLATVHTPDDLREEVAYFMPPEAIMDWWLENERPLPPSSYSADGEPAASKAVEFLAPADYAYVGANVEIRAAINREDAESWRLEYGVELNPQAWLPVDDPLRSSGDGQLAATWRTALLSGIHTLRLTVVFADGSQASDTRLLTFDNTPPAIQLRASPTSADQTSLSLIAEVSDNLAIERVEFYRGDELVAVDFDWPHGAELRLGESGDIQIRALAFDQVGNRAEARLRVPRESS